MIKNYLENVIAELEKTLQESSGVMFGLDMELENDYDNKNLHDEYLIRNKNHLQMYNALIILKQVLRTTR